jgi:alpha-glucosidase
MRDLRRLVDAYPGNRVLVGEVWLFADSHPAYYGRGDELHLVFDLPEAVRTPWEPAAWRERIERVAARLDPIGAWPTWVLSNHDVPRHRTRFGSEARARAAAVLLLTLRGTPFLYAGEELGLEDAVVPQPVDPGGRDGCRAPIPWEATAGHGWRGHAPWLPFPPEAERRNVETLAADPGSILHLYRQVLAARRTSPALRAGTCRLLPSPDGVLVFERVAGGDRRIVMVNFERTEVAVPAVGVVEVASDGVSQDQTYGGVIRADTALVLRPLTSRASRAIS